ncbi:MAG: hypothetical protein IEMM0008_1496 [bacterium]|nr:MAG: hypothetical protein IEMM0008_1496 [bacterium]
MYQVQIEEEAKKALARIHPTYKEKIKEKIYSLGHNPFPPASKKLKGLDSDFHCLRVSQYRVIYEVIEEEILVLIVKIGHRKDVYRNI